ncbi:SAVMC3_10250 family protein [Streptomyces sp. NBC_00140]|uniref:DUF7019 family protein n=1 Tax=Streptomyces sp. NBC_00140 TaxID=2975664 RepID=UPI002254C2AB|nr:SAVMC3_10250 family protein [Streptomyces sp. NBC_00140]MCX5328293.1 SAVMC3_10250 family protein [Streptomyces sp. NBC_00140]
MSLSYYVYISDSKVDMLLPQIDPGFGAKRQTEVGVNLSVLSAKRTSEGPPNDRITRLEAVVRYLRDHGDLGTVDTPGQYFWGSLRMRWGAFRDDPASSLVFFGGRSEDTVVALGGSYRHVYDYVPDAESHGVGRSMMSSMLDGLGITSDLEDEYVADAVDGDLDRVDRAALGRVERAVARLRWPAQNVEFVAKRLLHGESPDGTGTSVLLGTPLYAAVVD